MWVIASLQGEGIFSSSPFKGEGILSLLHLQGGGREGDGVRKRNAMLKCDKVELRACLVIALRGCGLARIEQSGGRG